MEIPEYILINLKRYGNAAIGERTFPSRISLKSVLIKLEQLGFNCRIKTFQNDVFDSEHVKKRRKTSRINYVIELIK